MGRGRLAGTAGLLALVTWAASAWAAVPAPEAGPVVDVDVHATLAPLPAALEGYAFDPRVARPAMRPPVAATYRMDASVEDLYDCRTGHLDPRRLAGLQGRLDTVESLHAVPIVILDYMPTCLAATLPGDVRDPQLLPPRDPATWQRVVTELVSALGPGRVARRHRPVTYLEAWNEPDALFWQGTPEQYVDDVMVPAGTAVAAVAARSRLPLRFSVAATTFPNPPFLAACFAAAAAHGIPIGFVSWHYYGDYPALGPDGGEPGEPAALGLVAGRRNPAASPLTMGAGVAVVRQTAQTVLGRVPELVLDEWNLSAGGFDLRNDTYAGAAFQAATLVELASTGLRRALLYAAVDVHSTDQAGKPVPVRHGDWGVVDRAGGRKPAWYAQRLFARLRGPQVAVPARPSPGVWLAASREGGMLHLLVAAFSDLPSAAAHSLTLRLHGLRTGWHGIVTTLVDPAHDGSRAQPVTRVWVAADGTATLAVTVGPQAVVALDVVLG